MINIYYLMDMWLSLFNNIFGHDAMAIFKLRVKIGFRNYSGGRMCFGDLRPTSYLFCLMIYKLLLINIKYLTRLNIRKILSNTGVKILTLRFTTITRSRLKGKRYK
jgi:hypothetical protein